MPSRRRWVSRPARTQSRVSSLGVAASSAPRRKLGLFCLGMTKSVATRRFRKGFTAAPSLKVSGMGLDSVS